jgi:hypothetical protein
MNDRASFDDFVEAVNSAGLPGESETAIRGEEAVPLTHTSGVSPKDWERVQKSLAESEE